MGAAGLIGGALLAGSDLIQNWMFNQRARDDRAAFETRFDEAMGRLDDPGLNPLFNFQGQQFGRTVSSPGNQFIGSAGDPLAGIEPGPFRPVGQPSFNLDEIFDTGQAQLDAFNELDLDSYNVPGADTDFKKYQDEITTLLGSGRERVLGALDEISPLIAQNLAGGRDLIDQLAELSYDQLRDLDRGVTFPEADLSDVLAADLAGQTRASAAREQFAREGLASQAGSFGGLANLGRALQSASSTEALNRATRAAQSRGEIRNRESAIEQFNASLQARLAMEKSAQQNAINLARMGFERDAALTQAGLTRDVGLAEAGAEGSFSFREADMLQDLLGLQAGQDQFNVGVDQRNRDLRAQMDLLGVDLAGRAEGDAVNAFNAAMAGIGQQQGVNVQNLQSLLGLGSILANTGAFSENMLLNTSLAPYFFPGTYGPEAAKPDGPGTQFSFGLPSLFEVQP